MEELVGALEKRIGMPVTPERRAFVEAGLARAMGRLGLLHYRRQEMGAARRHFLKVEKLLVGAKPGGSTYVNGQTDEQILAITVEHLRRV